MSGSGSRSACSRSGLDKHEAADAEIIELRIGAVGVGDEMAAERHVEGNIAGAFVGGAAIFRERVDADGPGRHAARDARVDHVDDAADRRGAEQQGRRAAQDFNSLRGQRVDRHLVVGSDEDRSSVPIPSTRMRTRSPDRPRRIGREAVGPKLEAVTPGWLARVSPMLGRAAR